MLYRFRPFCLTLWNGFRSILLLQPKAGSFELSLYSCIALCCTSLAALAVYEYVLSEGVGWFNPDGVNNAVAFYSLLIAYIAAASPSRVGVSASRTFAASVATTTVILAFMTIAVLLVRWAFGGGSKSIYVSAFVPWVAGWSLFVWTLIALFRLGYGLAERARIVAGFGLVALTILASWTLPSSSIFVHASTEMAEFSLIKAAADALKPPRVRSAQELRPSIDVEATLHSQPKVLAASLAAIKPPRDDRAEMYFVGMSPFASQDVFKRESEAVKTMFDTRFGTAGRSLSLINHRDTIGNAPLASGSNLDDALQHIGRMMRADKDVLVLFLTSHGGPGVISVSFPGFPLNNITSEQLKMSLDRAGIQNRVLFISACYSGSFIADLQSDTTLIMTAARADRTSFGCSNENHWTYFGDAYFNHALRTETSFIDAFATAKTLIANWEKRDGLEPSEPQIFVGSTIREKLAAITSIDAKQAARAVESASTSGNAVPK